MGGWLAQLGPRHAHTLHAQYGLALVLRDRGLTAAGVQPQYARARSLSFVSLCVSRLCAARTAYEEVIEGYAAVYGSLHPLTITAQKAAQALR